MNAGCYGREFKDIVISVQAIDFAGKVQTISSSQIKFNYRSTDLPKNLVYLSVTLKGKISKKDTIKKKIEELKLNKENSQPLRVKTSGSTFKNPINQTDKKSWELIKSSISERISYGDAIISEKHANFFVNKKNAKSADMKSLINFVKKKVKDKTGIKLELEIVVVE